MNEENNNKNMETSIALIKKDVDNFSQIINRIDITLEKMSDISNTVSRLLSLHEQRLDVLHEADKVLELKLEKNNNTLSEEIKELHQHIRNNNRDLIEKMKSTEDSIKMEIKNVKDAVDKDKETIQESIENLNENLQKSNRRIDTLERWKWVVIGGAAIVGWLINKLPFKFTIS